MPEEELVGLGFGELETEGAEDEAEFFVGEEAVFVGVEEVELDVWVRVRFGREESGGNGTYCFVDSCFLLVGELVEVFPCWDGVLYCAA